ncbi:TPA: DUF551 domain-containing protein [Escherichia coli]
MRTQCMLDALNRRAEYHADLEAMTPEQRAEHDAGIAEFKAMLGGDFRDLSQPVDPQVAEYEEIMDQAIPDNSFTNEELEAMAHGNNPQANAYRELLAFRCNSPATPDGWIPVSERMPEREVDVQVYCSDKKEQMVGYMERNEKDGWFRFASLPNGGGVYCNPTHWMPLQDPPKELG